MKSRHMEMDEKWAEWVGGWGWGVRIAMENARIGEVSVTVREECQRVMV